MVCVTQSFKKDEKCSSYILELVWLPDVTDNSGSVGVGNLESWKLKLYGTPMSPQQLQARRR